MSKPIVQASSFTPLQPVHAPSAPGWKAELSAALEGAAFTVPLSLGSVMVVYAALGPTIAASAVLVTLIALALLQLSAIGAKRPVLYSARFFEATTAAEILRHAIEHLPQWGLGDTPGLRLALLGLLLGVSGLVMVVLFVLRADRFSRHIPQPVFSGFSNGIAVVLFMSQVHALQALFEGGRASAPDLVAVGGISFVAGFAVRRWLPSWPAAGTSLGLGLLLALALASVGHPVDTLGSGHGVVFAAPFQMADWHGLAGARDPMSLLTWMAANGSLLGVMVFINTTVASQAMSHIDDRPAESQPRLLWTGLCTTAAGIAGAAPIAASLQSSLAASRMTRLNSGVMLSSAVVLLLTAVSGFIGWIPLAAVAGTLLCEAFYTYDKRSVRLVRQWAAGALLDRQAREDLALIAVVTATAVLVNMVASVVAGLLLGLLLFASRHLLHPVRSVSDGTQLASNCARSRADLQVLAEHARALRVVELEGDLFFGTMDQLDRGLRAAMEGASCMVLDWAGVRNVDSSCAQTIAKFQKAAEVAGVGILHVDPAASGAKVAAALLPILRPEQVAPDLDRALERAENHLLAERSGLTPQHGHAQAHGHMDQATLFVGMDECEQALLESMMTRRHFRHGETVVHAGEPGDSLMLMLEGAASVMVRTEGGHEVRVAGLRRGAVIGELAFLDRSPRSATVVAQDQVVVAELPREAFDRLSVQAPVLVQKLLANIALYLAARLRHTNRLAAVRRSRRS
ncbi:MULTISPECIES: cyclic nucleotide-binding domain-containing protein [Ramlibacter]|uniref:SLC26A/SulP transporter family protein n=1 Tax=Ramlibacter aquaticus TaxID=2780094 RepID=A0ABR9SJW7_9BURK|nr:MULTISPECIES: cyclic nucleotide-binding domain-containing protein [Ramlibacter]MBE7942337.1 SLC26A/SulP transporter family protein [Ramlibacter aquaticus]